LTYDKNPAPVSATSTFVTKTTEGGCKIEVPCHHSSRLTDHSFENSAAAAKDTAFVRVARLPYTTPRGKVGWYTGMVDSCSVPNGQGRMCTKTGNIIEGKWTDGYSDNEKLERRSSKMRGGFASRSTPWNYDQHRRAGSLVWSAPMPTVFPRQVNGVGMTTTTPLVKFIPIQLLPNHNHYMGFSSIRRERWHTLPKTNTCCAPPLDKCLLLRCCHTTPLAEVTPIQLLLNHNHSLGCK
jgi:hypothetical protein